MKIEYLPSELDKQAAGVPRAKLLLVDVDTEDLLYYSAVLQHLQYEVKSCASYTEAANFFAREDFDLVIVGQGGTSFEGRTVLARAVEADQNTPVLVLTRTADINCYVEAMQLGAFDYLEKPLSPTEIAELVHRHLRRTAPFRAQGRGAGAHAGVVH